MTDLDRALGEDSPTTWCSILRCCVRGTRPAAVDFTRHRPCASSSTPAAAQYSEITSKRTGAAPGQTALPGRSAGRGRRPRLRPMTGNDRQAGGGVQRHLALERMVLCGDRPESADRCTSTTLSRPSAGHPEEDAERRARRRGETHRHHGQDAEGRQPNRPEGRQRTETPTASCAGVVAGPPQIMRCRGTGQGDCRMAARRIRTSRGAVGSPKGQLLCRSFFGADRTRIRGPGASRSVGDLGWVLPAPAPHGRRAKHVYYLLS